MMYFYSAYISADKHESSSDMLFVCPLTCSFIDVETLIIIYYFDCIYVYLMMIIMMVMISQCMPAKQNRINK